MTAVLETKTGFDFDPRWIHGKKKTWVLKTLVSCSMPRLLLQPVSYDSSAVKKSTGLPRTYIKYISTVSFFFSIIRRECIWLWGGQFRLEPRRIVRITPFYNDAFIAFLWTMEGGG